MERIGFFDWPLEECMLGYRGLYRGNSILTVQGIPTSLLSDFIKISRDGCSAPYSSANLEAFKFLWERIHTFLPTTDLLIFSDEISHSVSDSSFQLIGYDICADSAYYSPVGSGLVFEVLRQGIRYQRISEEAAFAITLNSDYLISAHEDALIFAALCNILQEAGEYEFESELNWRPFSVWRFINKEHCRVADCDMNGTSLGTAAKPAAFSF